MRYGRDGLGRIDTVALSQAGTDMTLVTSTRYRPDGRVTARTFGNGLSNARAYDTRGRLLEQYLGSADTRLYSYDANGNLTGLQSIPQVGAYRYDRLNRLAQEARTTTATTNSSFTYDANGNRLSENTGTYAYLANSNRLTSTPSGSITLDAAGNTVSDGTRSYTYNNAGQLATVSGGVSYAYNHQRQRSRKLVAGTATVFHYDLFGNLIAETDASGHLQRDVVWADGTPIAEIHLTLRGGRPLPAKLPAGRLPAPATEQQLLYLHTDALDTPRVATDVRGQVVWRGDGAAFGETRPDEDPDGDGIPTTINLRFPGQYYDQETGLHYNWNRYYDPKSGRYITSDPIGLDGGLNTYSYVGNNPLRYTDPSGLLDPSPEPPAPPTTQPAPRPLPSGLGGALGGAARMCLRLAGPVAIIIEGMMPGTTGGCDDTGKCSDTRNPDDKCDLKFEYERPSFDGRTKTCVYSRKGSQFTFPQWKDKPCYSVNYQTCMVDTSTMDPDIYYPNGKK